MRVCHKNTHELTRNLKKAWAEITPDEIRAICAAAPRRIEAVVQNNGGNVEYLFLRFFVNTSTNIFCKKSCRIISLIDEL